MLSVARSVERPSADSDGGSLGRVWTWVGFCGCLASLSLVPLLSCGCSLPSQVGINIPMVTMAMMGIPSVPPGLASPMVPHSPQENLV